MNSGRTNRKEGRKGREMKKQKRRQSGTRRLEVKEENMLCVSEKNSSYIELIKIVFLACLNTHIIYI